MDPIQAMELEQKRAVVEAEQRRQQIRDELERAMRERVPESFRGGQVLPLVFYPDERLTQACAPVTEFNRGLADFTRDMATTMYLCGGVGLSACQVGVLKRVLVCDWGQQRGQLQVMINPVTVFASAGGVQMEEACLSIPGARVHIERPPEVMIRYQDVKGTPHEMTLGDWPARIVQHEMDHLDGYLMLSRASRLERRMAERRFAKILKSETARKPKGKRR